MYVHITYVYIDADLCQFNLLLIQISQYSLKSKQISHLTFKHGKLLRFMVFTDKIQ